MVTDMTQRIEAVRRFNRFYTKQIGIVTDQYLHTPYSLTEARVLYEIAHHEPTTATDICREIGMDAGHLSRILRNFKKRELIGTQPSDTDGRRSLVQLTKAGLEAFALLNTRSQNGIEALLNTLTRDDQHRVVEAMRTIETVFHAKSDRKVPYLLRPHRVGDMGWVVHSHGVLYTREYGWNEQFEAFVAEIVAKFIQHYDPAREHCWIAERDGENIGSAFLVHHSDTVAKLRLLLVEPTARGLGIGTRLVDECIRFARHAGYDKIVLWTNSVLLAARHVYAKAGFRLLYEEPHQSFGQTLVGETWELQL